MTSKNLSLKIKKKDIEGTIEASLDHEQLAIIEADRIFRDLVEKDLE